MSMNELLAKHYGTDKLASAAPAEQPAATLGDLSKEAQVDLFVKMAQDNGLDVASMSEEQVTHLFNETFKKEASAPPPAAGAAASDDPEMQAKLAQADFFGRQMAHAYVNELHEISMAKQAAATAKVASALKTAEEKEKEEKEKKDKDEKGEGDKGEKKLPPWMMDKKASAEVLAGQIAVQHIVDFNKTAAPEARYDEWQAVDRIGAVLTLGAPSEKTATVVDAASRVQVQALEILQAAGYPVNWSK